MVHAGRRGEGYTLKSHCGTGRGEPVGFFLIPLLPARTKPYVDSGYKGVRT